MILRAEIIDNATGEILEASDFTSQADLDTWQTGREESESFGAGQEKSIKVVDITAEVALENGMKEGLYAQLLGNQVVALVYYVNATSGFDASKLMQIMQDPSIAIIERLLRGGALEQAQTLLGSIGNSIYTPAQITQISAFIDKQVAIRDQFDPTKA